MSGPDVLVVGGGVAGLSAAIYTARAGLDTEVYDHDQSILNRNAHLENYPGFPAGVNSRLFLEMCADQAERNGADLRRGEVVDVTRAEDGEGFDVAFAERPDRTATHVVAASWADSSYLDGLGVEREQRGSKRFILPEEGGRTDIDGLYAAGRLADMYHQTVVAAGHGAQAAITLIHDSPVDFYHDWVAPEGYFTGRDREVPPGCEEIDETERRHREEESLAVMREYFGEPHPEEPTMHPSVADED